MKIDYNFQSTFSSDQIILLEAHSVLNVIGTTVTCIREIRKESGISNCFANFYDALIAADKIIRTAQPNWLSKMESTDTLNQLFQQELESYTNALSDRDTCVWKSFEEILSMAQETLIIRLIELKVRQGSWEQWTERTTTMVHDEIEDFFRRLYLNALRNPCQQIPSDFPHGWPHHVTISVRHHAGNNIIKFPDVLRDSIRDLSANARKYTPHGGKITVTISQEPTLFALTVQDTGRGIPSEDLPAIVQFGKRGSNTSDKLTHGGGFGLSKAFYIAQKFNGHLTVDSELGKGTTVTLSIPIT